MAFSQFFNRYVVLRLSLLLGLSLGALGARAEAHDAAEPLHTWSALADDSRVTALIALALKDSPTLQSSEIAYRRALRQAGIDSAAPLAQATAQLLGLHTTSTSKVSRSGQLQFGWELDYLKKSGLRQAIAYKQALTAWQRWHEQRWNAAARVAQAFVEWRSCERVAAKQKEIVNWWGQLQKPREALLKQGAVSHSAYAQWQLEYQKTVAKVLEQAAQCDALLQSLVAAVQAEPSQVLAVLHEESRDSSLGIAVGVAPESLPAHWLQNRADIKAALLQVQAARLNVQLAKAQRWPSLTLQGVLTWQPGTWALNWGPSLTAALLDAGQGAERVDSAELELQRAHVLYRQAVLNAAHEAELALLTLELNRQRLEQAHMSLNQAQAQLREAQYRYDAGVIAYVDLVQAQIAQLSAQQVLYQTKGTYVKSWVDSVRVMGANWRSVTTQESNPSFIAEKDNS